MSTFDVLAVDGQTKCVRVVAQDREVRAAEEIVGLAAARACLEEEFFILVPKGQYREGETYVGH